MANPAVEIDSLDGSSHFSDVVPVTTSSAVGVSSTTTGTTTLAALTVHASSSFSSDSHQADPSSNEGTQEQNLQGDMEQFPDPEPGCLASGNKLQQATPDSGYSLKGLPVEQETVRRIAGSFSSELATNDEIQVTNDEIQVTSEPCRTISSERYSEEGEERPTAKEISVEGNQVFVGDNLEKVENITSQHVKSVTKSLQAVCQENQSENLPPDLNSARDFRESGDENVDRESNGQLAIHDQQQYFKEEEEIGDEQKLKQRPSAKEISFEAVNQVLVGDNLEKVENITSQHVKSVTKSLQAVCQENQSENLPPDLNNARDVRESGDENVDRESNGQLAIHDQQQVFKEEEGIGDEQKVEQRPTAKEISVAVNQVFVGDNLEKVENITSQDVKSVTESLQAVCQENQSENLPPDLNNARDVRESGDDNVDRESNGQLAVQGQQQVFKEEEEIGDEQKVGTEQDQVREPQDHCQNDLGHQIPPPKPSCDLQHWRTCKANIKPGNLIAVRRFGGAYFHYMVFIGNGEVVHATGGIPDWILCSKGKIKREKVEDVLKPGDLVYIEDETWEGKNPLPAQEIVKRAYEKVGKEGFSLLYSNCEHFARLCRYNVECSRQGDTLQGILGICILVLFMVCLMLYVLYCSNTA